MSKSGRRIHEVDRVGHAVADGELDRVHVVSEGAHQRARLRDDAGAHVRRQESVVVVVFPFFRIVLDRQDVLTADADAAHELVPLDEFLHDHRQHAAVVVVVDQFFERMAHVYVAPAAAVRILEDAGQADMIDHALPVEWILQVAERFVVLDAGHVLLVGQRHRLRRAHTVRLGQRGAEKLVVGGPHEGIVDDGHARQRGVLEPAAVERHLVRDPVDHHIVGDRFIQRRRAQRHKLGGSHPGLRRLTSSMNAGGHDHSRPTRMPMRRVVTCVSSL